MFKKSYPFLKISSIFYFSYLDDSNKIAKGIGKFGREVLTSYLSMPALFQGYLVRAILFWIRFFLFSFQLSLFSWNIHAFCSFADRQWEVENEYSISHCSWLAGLRFEDICILRLFHLLYLNWLENPKNLVWKNSMSSKGQKFTFLVKFDQKVIFLLFLVKNLKIRLGHAFFCQFRTRKVLS